MTQLPRGAEGGSCNSDKFGLPGPARRRAPRAALAVRPVFRRPLLNIGVGFRSICQLARPADTRRTPEFIQRRDGRDPCLVGFTAKPCKIYQNPIWFKAFSRSLPFHLLLKLCAPLRQEEGSPWLRGPRRGGEAAGVGRRISAAPPPGGFHPNPPAWRAGSTASCATSSRTLRPGTS